MSEMRSAAVRVTISNKIARLIMNESERLKAANYSIILRLDHVQPPLIAIMKARVISVDSWNVER